MALVRFIAELFCRWRSSSAPTASNPQHALGRRGEKLAARFLRKHGYKVLYRNFRAPHGGEVDIVCRDRDTLVFVEVKTRTSMAFGRPVEAVNRDKQELIARGAQAWLRMLDQPNILVRFDVVEVLVEQEKPVLNLIRNAFQLGDRHLY